MKQNAMIVVWRDPGSCPNSYCKRKPDHPDLPPGINERTSRTTWDTYGVS